MKVLVIIKNYGLNSKSFDKANIWDFFFILNSQVVGKSAEDWLWCDVEKLMLQWLYNASDRNHFNSKENWELVYEIIASDNITIDYDEKLYILAAVAYKKNNEIKFKNREEFYMFLLSQLKEFEINFGKYILNLHYRFIPGTTVPKTAFKLHALDTIEKLCDLNNLVGIDSFNYDDLEDDSLNKKLNNINGNVNYPIFGIDSNAFIAPDIRYIFSKTNRRMEMDMSYEDYQSFDDFENLVIFGHSLNEADYSYFFSVFDKLDIIDLTNNSKIVFAYSVYDDSKEVEIKMNLRTAISKMFIDYSIYRGKNEQPNRLLDALTSQNKVIMYEIPSIHVM